MAHHLNRLANFRRPFSSMSTAGSGLCVCSGPSNVWSPRSPRIPR